MAKRKKTYRKKPKSVQYIGRQEVKNPLGKIYIVQAYADLYEVIGASASKDWFKPEVINYLQANRIVGINQAIENVGTDIRNQVDELFTAVNYSNIEGAQFKPTKNDVDIRREDWLPYKNQDLYDLEEDFLVWLKTIMYGFSRAGRYRKFELYVRQAKYWLEHTPRFEDFTGIQEKINFVGEEVQKFRTNSLYFILKYGVRADEDEDSGVVDFKNPYAVQMAICYLFDLGYSLLIPKIRQLGFSTLIGHLLYVKTAYKYNFRTKFIASDKEKAVEIFRDKVNFISSNLPFYIKPVTTNDSELQLSFSDSTTRGEKIKGKRIIMVSAPNDDAINGGSPAIYAIDEAGDVSNLRTMLSEADPAMFKDSKEVGKRIKKRQGIIWGTGGKMKTDAFEGLVLSTVKAWEKGEYLWEFVVIFADYYSRPMNTHELYETLRKKAYNQEGEDAEDLRRQFHAHYAVTLEDVFLRSTNTLIPIPYINAAIKRIDELKIKDPTAAFVRGKFDCDYYENEEWPAGAMVGLPKKVKSVYFIRQEQTIEEIEGGGSTLYTPPISMIPVAPDLRWSQRYFMGTDPINSSSGKSRFSSTVWDSLLSGPMCVLDYRTEDIRQVYRQCILMNLYYGKCPHLIEYNIGQTLIEAIGTMDMRETIIMNKTLPVHLQVQGSKIGISNKAGIRDRIIDEMQKLFMDYRDTIWFDVPFVQLKTFTQENGRRWEADNDNIHRDDVLFSMTFAKIASDTYRRMGYLPQSPEQIQQLFVNQRRLVRKNGVLSYENKVVEVNTENQTENREGYVRDQELIRTANF